MQNFIDSTLKEKLEKDFGVKIYFFDEYKHKYIFTKEDAYNFAGVDSDNTIYLGFFDDPKEEILCLFHEIGHLVSNRRKKPNTIFLCELVEEALAWEIAIELILDYSKYLNFTFNFNDINSIDIKSMKAKFYTYVKELYEQTDEIIPIGKC